MPASETMPVAIMNAKLPPGRLSTSTANADRRDMWFGPSRLSASPDGADRTDYRRAGVIRHDPARWAFVGSVRPQAHISDRFGRHRSVRFHLLRDAEHDGPWLDLSRDRAVLCPTRP